MFVFASAKLLQPFIANVPTRKLSLFGKLVACHLTSSHGEVMWAWRTMLEYISQQEYTKLDLSKELTDRLHNGQILHYTRRDPQTHKLHDDLRFTRSICPWDSTISKNVWVKLVKKWKTNEELLAEVENVPRVLTNSTPFPVAKDYLDEKDGKSTREIAEREKPSEEHVVVQRESDVFFSRNKNIHQTYVPKPADGPLSQEKQQQLEEYVDDVILKGRNKANQEIRNRIIDFFTGAINVDSLASDHWREEILMHEDDSHRIFFTMDHRAKTWRVVKRQIYS
jgi:hypothetical protein